MRTNCAYEFKLRRFGFEDCPPNRFYTFQWSNNRGLYVAYRAISFFFHLGWLIAGWIHRTSNYHLFLTNWSFLYTSLYLLFAFGTAFYGLIRWYYCMEVSTLVPAMNNKQIELPGSNKESDPEIGVKSKSNRANVERATTGKLKWFHIITWFMHTISIDTILFVTVVYWATVFPTEDPELRQGVLGYSKHVIHGAMLLIDLFLINFPVRYLHAIYMVISSTAFSLFLVILHVTGFNSAVYNITNFAKSPTIAYVTVGTLALVMPWIAHAIIFAFYHLRLFIFSNCSKQST